MCTACLLLDPAVQPIQSPNPQHVDHIQARGSQQVQPIQAPNPQHVEPIQAPSPQDFKMSPFRAFTLPLSTLPGVREPSREPNSELPSANAHPNLLQLNQDALSLLCRIRRGDCNRLLPMSVRASTELLAQLRDAASTIFKCPLPDAIALRALDVSRYLPGSAGKPTVLGAFRCLTDGERGPVDAHDANADELPSSHHEVINVPSKSPARHPARTSNESTSIVTFSTLQKSTSIVTFSTLQKGGSVVRSPPIPSSRCPLMSRMKLKRNPAISSNSSAAVDDATLVEDLECMSFPVALQNTASFDAPVELAKTPSSLCARFPLKEPSPSKPVLSPTPNPLQTKSTASPQSFKAALNKAAVELPVLLCVKSCPELPIPLKTDSPPIQDDSPVSRLLNFRELMNSRPGTYGFITSTQTDGVHVESRGTQTSPPPPCPQVHQTLTVEDLRNELAIASLALVKAFGF